MDDDFLNGFLICLLLIMVIGAVAGCISSTTQESRCDELAEHFGVIEACADWDGGE